MLRSLRVYFSSSQIVVDNYSLYFIDCTVTYIEVHAVSSRVGYDFNNILNVYANEIDDFEIHYFLRDFALQKTRANESRTTKI